MRTTFIVLFLAALAGCAAPTIYRDPKTGAVQQCVAQHRGLITRAYSLDQCEKSFERMGWQKQQ